MGLDMYLTAKRFVRDWDEQDNELNESIKKLDLPYRVQLLEMEAMYWRKANAIHKWFVDNVQNGVDNCAEYFVDRTKLEKLLEICKAVKSAPETAPVLLPTTSGFFFGDTQYDDWYWGDIDSTIDALEKALQQNDRTEFFYSSSW